MRSPTMCNQYLLLGIYRSSSPCPGPRAKSTGPAPVLLNWDPLGSHVLMCQSSQEKPRAPWVRATALGKPRGCSTQAKWTQFIFKTKVKVGRSLMCSTNTKSKDTVGHKRARYCTYGPESMQRWSSSSTALLKNDWLWSSSKGLEKCEMTP